MKVLLKHKADCAIGNKKKELPLHRACASNVNIEVGVSHIKAFYGDRIKGGHFGMIIVVLSTGDHSIDHW